MIGTVGSTRENTATKEIGMKRDLKRLGDLEALENGAIGEVFTMKLGQLMADVVDRPALEKARKLTVELELTPVSDNSGNLTEVRAAVQVKTTSPAQRTAEVSMKWGAKRGALVWNDESPDDVRQGTLDEEQGRRKP